MRLTSLKTAVLVLGCVLFAGAALPAETAKTLDNDHVLVRDVLDAAGKPLGIAAGRDAFVIDVINAKAEFLPKGKAANAPSAKVVVIELKRPPSKRLANTSGYPDAFPRPNVKKLMENAQGTVWDYTWIAGMPPPTHFHTTAVVPVFLLEGALRSESPNGEKIVTPHSVGAWRYQDAGRLHTEHLDSGAARAIVVELN